MNWTRIIQGFSDVLSVALIIRLLALKLHSVYRVFCVFLIFELVSSSVVFLEALAHNPHFDYRISWMMLRAVAWTLTIWMIYALIMAILARLPGIQRFSRWLLIFVFFFALGLALLTARPEYAAAGLSGNADPIARTLGVALVVERVLSTIAMLVLLLMLGFVLWFPVQMPRNLAVFSIGFVAYFSAKTTLLLIRSFWTRESFDLVSDGIDFILCACFVYWLIFITKAGEFAPVRIGHSWRASDQDRLIGQLEAMNAALLRAARR